MVQPLRSSFLNYHRMGGWQAGFQSLTANFETTSILSLDIGLMCFSPEVFRRDPLLLYGQLTFFI
jgi:hypothetical protein